MYGICIYHKNAGPVTDQDEAKRAVEGTGIEIVEAGGYEGNWLVKLPTEISEPLEEYGFIEMDTEGFEIRTDWSD